MKKLLIILSSLQMLSCNTTDSAQGTVNIPFLQKEKPVYDPNAYVNAAFGYSVPVIDGLRLVPTEATNMLSFIDARTESRDDILMIIPFTESMEEMAQNLQSAGTPFQRLEGGITFSLNSPGQANIAGSYLQSPFGKGGVGILRVITGAALLDVNALNRLYAGMRFYEPQASEAERIGYLQSDADKQKQSNENDRWMGYFRDQMGVNPFN